MTLRVGFLLFLHVVWLCSQTREQRWEQDIQFFSNQFKTVHPAPFAKVSAADFDQAVSTLTARVADLADYEILLGLNRIAALVGDAHSWMYTFQANSGMRQFPIRVRWLKDGYYIAAANSNYVRALGKKVVAINGVPVTEAYAKMRLLIPAENNWWAIQQSQAMLVSPEALHSAGVVANSADPVMYSFEDGLTLALRVEGGTLIDYPRKARPATPLFRRNAGLIYWFDYLEDSRTLYIQYNQCAQDPALRMSEFARQLVEFLAGKSPERVVIDLRNNTGGDSRVIEELLAPLQALYLAGQLQPRNNYVFISRQTFSSGMLNAADLKSSGLIQLVGEPTGGSPNGPGEVRGFTLPNSRLNGQMSSRLFAIQGYAGKNTIEPDILIEATIDDLTAERDPLLETVLKN